MLIAKIKSGQIIEVADYNTMFPNTSFPASGPTEGWMIDNGCMYVNTGASYDPSIEKLVPVTPYIQSDDATHWVYTTKVEPLTPEEIEQQNEFKRQQNKTQAESLLQQTDWTATVDIADPQYSNPYLGNQPEFLAYRSALRQIAVNPPITVETWPVKPDEVWVTV